MQRINVLIIEDNPGDVILVREYFEDDEAHEYNITESGTLKNSISILANQKVDIILLDLSLPDSNGEETFLSLKSTFPDIPIILLTGYEDKNFAVKLLKDGAQDYLLKNDLTAKNLQIAVAFAVERNKLTNRLNYELKERLKAEYKIKEYAEQLEKTIQNRDKFFKVIAHDLRSPFHGLLNFSEMLIDEDENITASERQSIYKAIHSISNSLYNLINNLLSWANYQRDKIKIVVSEIDIESMIEEFKDIFNNQISFKKITIEYVTNGIKKIFADEITLKTIIRNLISNAIKFSQTGRNIIFKLEKNDEDYIFSIQDFGKGIDDEIIDNLFQEELVSTKGTEGESGSGFGLKLCKELIELNKGSIWFETEKDKGTTFYFNIPIINN